MASQLVPEARPDCNGKVVIRHVRVDPAPAHRGPGLPSPALPPGGALRSVPLKDMDSGALTVALLSDVRELEADGKLDSATVFDALSAATFLHRNQTRANRKDLPRTPYIEHPLRNTLRAVRWGCADQDVLVATVLHDTVEDCAEDILTHYLGRADAASVPEEQQRELALGWVRESFGAEVGRIVEALSNPLSTGPAVSAERKREQYAEHVAEAIRGDEKTFVAKFADFVDNALGLPHNDVEGNGAMVRRLAAKYRPVAAVFQHEFEGNPRIRNLVDDEGHRRIREQIEEADGRLAALLN